MNSKIKIWFYVIPFLLVYPGLTFGQEPQGVLSQLDKVRSLFGSTKNALDETLQRVENQKDAEKAQRLGISPQVMKELNALGNPFAPQLPRPPEPEEESPPEEIPDLPREEPAPMEPAPLKEEHVFFSRDAFELSGLIWDSDRPQAILNGQIVNIGDRLDQWTVLHIDKQGVEVGQKNKVFLIEP